MWRARWSWTDPPAAPAMVLDRSPGHRAHTCSPARPERTPPRRRLRASAAPITIEQRESLASAAESPSPEPPGGDELSPISACRGLSGATAPCGGVWSDETDSQIETRETSESTEPARIAR
eukprot:scaffold4879_cov101-Isochrysis_galbana.AAC.3